MVIDAHVHVLNAEPGHLERLLAAADRAEIDRLCISSLSRQWTEFPTAEQLDEAAADVSAACDQRPDRFIGGVYVSADHGAASLDLMDQFIGRGPCRFVKLWVSQFCDDPRLTPIIERAVELDAPVLAHTWIKATGNLARESTAHHAVNLARRHPNLKLWMAHYSGRWEEAARIIQDVPNLRLDLSGGEPEDGILDCLLEHLPPERIFFGSDAPGRSFVVQMTKVTSAAIDPKTRRRILGDNVREWLHV